jgi:uncharacterized repeat protein (TIGR01451 family)
MDRADRPPATTSLLTTENTMLARLKLLAIKSVLLTTTLGVAGYSAYYFGPEWLRDFGRRSLGGVELEASSDAASTSTLDAVAHAWAGDEPSHASSKVAPPSATVAKAPKKSAKPNAVKPATKAEADRYATADDSSLARGQEPDADSDDELFAGGSDSAYSRPGKGSHVARAAFTEEEKRHNPSSGDRYGDGGESAQVNPFASKSTIPALDDRAKPIADAGYADIPKPPARKSTREAFESARDLAPLDTPPRELRTASALPSNAYEAAAPLRSAPVPTHARSNTDLPDYGMAPVAVGNGRPGERALEGPQQPSVLVQKFAPPEIQVGKPAQFTVKVRNAGEQPAADVVVSDSIPQGTQLLSTTPRSEQINGAITWELGTLSPGEERLLEMQVMPTEEGEIGSVATVTFAAQASAKTTCTMPKLAIRMTAPSKVMLGEEQRVKIELHNPGTGDATGVMLFENVPENLSHQAGKLLEFEIGTLHAGETREMELVLLAEKSGRVRNTISAKGDGNLKVQQQVEFDVIAPELEVALDGPQRRYLERPATYLVTVANPGTAAAKDVELITKLPKGLRFVRANNMGEYDAANHAVYWSLAELPEGERGTVEFVAMPVEAGEHTVEVEGKAQQGLADQTAQDVLVEGIAALMFEVKDRDDPIEVGGETTYDIRVVNQGSKSATGVTVRVAIPPEMQVVSAEGESRHALQAGGVVFEAIPELAPKAEAVYHIKVQGTRAGDQRITVEVDADDYDVPIRKEESTRVFGDE